MGRIYLLPCVPLLRNLRALVSFIQALKYFASLEIQICVGMLTCEVLDQL
jgi:hypothetical protein